MGDVRAMPLDLPRTRDIAFWRGLAEQLHVVDPAFWGRQSPLALPETYLAGLRHTLHFEGYFQLPSQNWKLPLDAMANLVRLLEAQGLPLPLCFMYDEFWALYYRLDKLIEGMLGPGYLRLPDFWAWLIDPQKGQSGWKPHRDKGWTSLFPDRSPQSLTVWLPLTDATPLNGCMYVVPADRDPVYGTPDDAKLSHRPWEVRALPAQAGSVLCWTQALLHWGGSSSPRETSPRISVAFEFQSCQVKPFNQPLTKPQEIPGFALRLHLIGKQILQYRHMYPLTPAIEQLATSFIQAGGAPEA